MSAVANVVPLIAFWSPGPGEMLLIGVIALLLYGGRLPDVAKEWGKTFSELKRNLTGVQNDFRDAFNAEPESPRLEYHPDFREEPYRETSHDETIEEDAEPFDENTLYEGTSPDPIDAGKVVNEDAEVRDQTPS